MYLLSINVSLSPLLVQHNSNSVSVVVFPCSHEYVFGMCLPIFWLGKASKARSVTLHPACNLRARQSFLRFFHISALMPCFFVARWKWCLFLLFFPLSLFSFIVFLPHRSLLPPAVLLLLSSFLLLESLLPLTVLFLSFLLLLVVLSLCYSSKLRILSGTSSSTFRNLRLPLPLPFGSSCSCIFVSLSPLSWCLHVRYRNVWGRPKLSWVWRCRTPSRSPLQQPTFWLSTHGIFVKSFCTSPDDPSLDVYIWTLPNQLLGFDQVWRKVCYTVLSSTVCTAQAKSRSGDSFHHLHRHLFLCLTFFLFFAMLLVYILCVFLFIEDLSHHLFRFFVARFDVFGSDSIAVCLFCLFLSLQLFSRDFWNFFHLFRIGASVFYVVFSLVFVVFRLSIIILIVLVQLAVEFSKDIGNSFSWCIDFASFIFYLSEEYSSVCRFYAGNDLDSFEVFEYSVIFLAFLFFCLWCIF